MASDTIPAESENCATALKVLADDTRLAVVGKLMAGPMNVGEINETLGVEQTLLSHHLKVLRDAGIVSAQRDGKHMLYALAKSVQSSRKGKAIDLGCCKISFQ